MIVIDEVNKSNSPVFRNSQRTQFLCHHLEFPRVFCQIRNLNALACFLFGSI